MISKIKLLIPSVLLYALIIVALFAPGKVHAAPTDPTSQNACIGVDLKLGGTCDQGKLSESESKMNKLVATIINLFSVIVGIVAVIMIIFAGFKYITAGGDSNSVSQAKTTLIYAIVGLIIAALAQVIARFVLFKATS